MELTYGDYCFDRGALRQRDLAPTMTYDRAYLDSRYRKIDAKVRALSAKRLAVLSEYAGPPGNLLDYGCGTGRFVDAAGEAGFNAYGHDAVPREGLLTWRECTKKQPWDVVTFFDSLEHLRDPAGVILSLRPSTIMVSVPECHFYCPDWFMEWKHRRPGEHLWHWSRAGLDMFMSQLGYINVHACHFEDEFRERYDPWLPNILTCIYYG